MATQTESTVVIAPLGDGDLKNFQDLIYRLAGIRMSDRKRSLIESRLRKRLQTLHLWSWGAYLERIADDKVERDQCLEILTTNETFFFRHRQHWDCLSQRILPEWRSRAQGGRQFRFWSAAASTGEEVWSAAMVLDDALRSPQRFSILGTDINSQVLAQAQTATYGSYALQKATQECLGRYFGPADADGNRSVVPRLRSSVTLRQHNLLNPMTETGFDCIFIRNVLIYFDEDSKSQALRHVINRLRPGGYLILGGSESLSRNAKGLTYVQPTIFQKAGL